MMQAPAIEQAIEALDAKRPEVAQRLLAQTPRTGLAWAVLARTYAALNKPAEAAAAARQADATTDPQAQHMLALYHAQHGSRARAAQLERNFALSPLADPAAAARAAFLLAETGDAANAIAMGERALTKQDRAEIRQLLARLYENTRQPDKAIEQHQAILKARPYDEQAHGEYGQALLRMGRFQQAVTALEESRRIFDKSPQIELALGVGYYSLRRNDDAATCFLRVIDLDPAIPQPYVFLSKMLDTLGDRLPQTRQRFEAWHRAETKSHLPPLVYARALPIGERKPLLAESIRREGGFWESHFELAQVLEHENNLAGAAREYEATVKLDARQAQAHYRLARLYDRLQRPADAARHRQIHAKLVEAQTVLNGGGMGR
jgi:tetratricopeptide (TPR) repeat protein